MYFKKGDIIKYQQMYAIVLDVAWIKEKLKISLVTQTNDYIQYIDVDNFTDDTVFGKFNDERFSCDINVNIKDGVYDEVFKPFKMNYVLAFAFDDDKIIMIRKNRPKYQNGKLNGVGGKIENAETAIMAMVREFKEETGVSSYDSDWVNFANVINHFYILNCFKIDLSGLSKAVKTVTDEPIEIHEIKKLYKEQLVGDYLMLLSIALNDDILNTITIRTK